MSNVDWSQLPSSGQAALRFLAQLMQQKFTGRVEVYISDGGVKNVSQSKNWNAKDLEAEYPKT